MKINIAFFAILLFCSQSFATDFQIKEQSTEYILSELVALNEMAGVPKAKILNLIRRIGRVANGVKRMMGAYKRKMKVRCTVGKRELTQYKKKLVIDFRLDEGRRRAANKATRRFSRKINRYHKKIHKARKGLTRVALKYKKQIAHHKKFKIEAYIKLHVLKRLRDIILDELVNGSKPGAFVQIKEFKDNVQQLQKKLNSMSDSVEFTPIISALVTLATQKNFSNQKILRRILALLKKLRRNLLKFLGNHARANKRLLVIIGRERKAKISVYRSLRKSILSFYSRVALYRAVARHAGNNKALVYAQIKKKNIELRQWNKFCNYQKAFIGYFTKDHKGLGRLVSNLVKLVKKA